MLTVHNMQSLVFLLQKNAGKCNSGCKLKITCWILAKVGVKTPPKVTSCDVNLSMLYTSHKTSNGNLWHMYAHIVCADTIIKPLLKIVFHMCLSFFLYTNHSGFSCYYFCRFLFKHWGCCFERHSAKSAILFSLHSSKICYSNLICFKISILMRSCMPFFSPLNKRLTESHIAYSNRKRRCLLIYLLT